MKPWVGRVLNHGVSGVVSGLARTWRIERRYGDRFRTAREGPGPVLFLLWHEYLLPLLYCHRNAGIAIVVSEARDGIYLADTARRLGYRPLGGSSSRGAVKALRAVFRHLRNGGLVAMTPDGPRGPRRSVKPGGLAAAQRSAAMVIPVAAAAQPAWRLSSWDRFVVPKPFAQVRVGYGQPFRVDDGEEALRGAVIRLEEAMRQLEEELRWPDAVEPTG